MGPRTQEKGARGEGGGFGSALTRASMRRPVSVLVLAAATLLAALLALRQTRTNVLPDINLPTIYVAQNYGGMQPAQMEAYITSLYEALFLFVSGVKHIDSKSIQSISLIKLEFYPGTNMAQALAEVTTYVNRARASLPAGTVPPFVMRFGVSNQPVGDLIFSSKDRSLVEIANYALNQVRPLFGSLPGVSASAPFGSNFKAVLVTLDPAKLKRFSVSADDVVRALAQGDLVSPSGNIPVAGNYPAVILNSVVRNVQTLKDVPLRPGTTPTVFLGDVATVSIGGDIQTGYALVNGRRTVYIPVTKQDQASTLTVVNEVRKALPFFQSVLPRDIKVSFGFDQSGAVRQAIGSLVFEGVLGALLTGLMVLLFLADWRSALIVVLNIPLAVLGATVALWATGQTINIMTLGGLALAIGVLVDETTVTIENIHSHLEAGAQAPRASLEATSEIFVPKLFTLLAFLIVFTPAFFMTGIPHDLFVPLALAVGFTLTGSFVLSATFVPVVSTYLLRAHGKATAHPRPGFFDRLRGAYASLLGALMPRRGPVLALYFVGALGIAAVLFGFRIGREIFPPSDYGQFRIRFRGPAGTYMDRTEASVLKAIRVIDADVGGADKVDTTLAYVGAQAYNLPVNSIYLWTSGPQDAVLDVQLKPGVRIALGPLEERLRADLARALPGMRLSFEPSNLVDLAMSAGATTPIEVDVSGFNLPKVRAFADPVLARLKGMPFLRDQQFGQALDYPALDVRLNRRKAGLAGVTMRDVSDALVPATASSRFTTPTFWADTTIGTSFIIEAQIPQGAIHSAAELRRVPLSLGGATLPLGDVARVVTGTTLAEIDRHDGMRTMAVTANLEGLDLGRASDLIRRDLAPLIARRPRGISVHMRGESSSLKEMFDQLGGGLALALAVVLILLAVNFESLGLALVVLATAPAVLAGVALALASTGTTLNIESYMGAIMAVGVALANSILMVTFAERERLRHGDSAKAALDAARGRLRPILMTSFAMVAGMVPMALGLSEGGGQTAPLGRAVIGGLAAATPTTLLVLPLLFAAARRRSSTSSPSLDPDDPESPHFEEAGRV